MSECVQLEARARAPAEVFGAKTHCVLGYPGARTGL